jgi:hypothetical protein
MLSFSRATPGTLTSLPSYCTILFSAAFPLLDFGYYLCTLIFFYSSLSWFPCTLHLFSIPSQMQFLGSTLFPSFTSLYSCLFYSSFSFHFCLDVFTIQPIWKFPHIWCGTHFKETAARNGFLAFSLYYCMKWKDLKLFFSLTLS